VRTQWTRDRQHTGQKGSEGVTSPSAPSVGAGTHPGASSSVGVERLGFVPGQVVQEFGYDDDVDDPFRFALEDLCGTELEDEDFTGEVDAVLLWWRAEDGDLGDALVDTVGMLGDTGFVVLVTPKPGKPEEVDASEIDEAAVTAGLHAGGSTSAGDGWRATKLVAPKGRR